MPKMKEIDAVRMKRRQKEVEVKVAESKVYNLKKELIEFDDKIIFLTQQERNPNSAGFGSLPI